jgi:hypothetical protein
MQALHNILSIPEEEGEQTTSSSKYLQIDLATANTGNHPLKDDIMYTMLVQQFMKVPGIDPTPDHLEKKVNSTYQLPVFLRVRRAR